MAVFSYCLKLGVDEVFLCEIVKAYMKIENISYQVGNDAFAVGF